MTLVFYSCSLLLNDSTDTEIGSEFPKVPSFLILSPIMIHCPLVKFLIGDSHTLLFTGSISFAMLFNSSSVGLK